MLEDLGECINLSRGRASSIPLDLPFVPSPEIWGEVVSAYKRAAPSDEVLVVNNALVVTSPNGNFLTISAQEIPRCWAVLPYVRATKAYEEKLDELTSNLGFPSRGSAGVRDEVFKRMPSATWETEVDASWVTKIRTAVATQLGLTPAEQDRFLKFLTDKAWSGVSKTLERTDWRSAAIQAAGQWLAVAAARRGELADALALSPHFDALMSIEAHKEPLVGKEANGKPAEKGRNIIIYGAPGTGKSHLVDATVGKINVVRTVFHPDTQNSDFFGCLKPRMDGQKVTYRFAPGPFSRSICKAFLDPLHHHFLVIEELNRAPAAAVFGELFQLLDREDDGEGKYAVDFPNEESREWFEAQGADKTLLVLPSNLSIYATMNSADQGVYPLDTAFRRRWEQNYLPLYGPAGPSGKISFTGKSLSKVIEWRQFVKLLNEYLVTHYSVAEDRLIGLWFVKEQELGGGVPAKILLYLWDDLLRHEDRRKIFATGIKTYGQLNDAIEKGQSIFSDELRASFEAAADELAPQGPAADNPLDTFDGPSANA